MHLTVVSTLALGVERQLWRWDTFSTSMTFTQVGFDAGGEGNWLSVLQL